MTQEAKAKARVTYPKELREQAKTEGLGLFTVHARGADETSGFEQQGMLTALGFRILSWAATLTGWCATHPHEESPSTTLERFIRRREAIAVLEDLECTGPCPSCEEAGRVSVHTDRQGGAIDHFQVICSNCGARGPRKPTNTEAIESWRNL